MLLMTKQRNTFVVSYALLPFAAGQRMGTVVRVRCGGLSYWQVGSEKQGSTSW
jgi:hypothetical protein